MRKIYLLVQNDVRTGPFTLKELSQLPLHAESLVWVIGESEDWLSPLEIPSLRQYFTQNEAGQLLLKESVVDTILSNPEENTSFTALPTAAVQESEINQSSFTHSFSQTVLERKEKLVQAVNQTFSKAKRQRTERTAIGSDKEEENEEPSGLGKNKWPILATFSLLVLLIIWSILFNGNDQSKEPVAYKATPSTSLPSSIVSTEEVSFAESVDENSASGEMPIVVPAVETSQSSHSAYSTERFLDSVARVLDSQDQLMASVDEVYKKSFRYPKRSAYKASLRSRNKGVSALAVTSNKTKQASNLSAIPVRQQIDLQSRYIRNGNKQNLSGVEVMVKNNSKQLLKSVSVDVFYYKKGEYLVDKETVYFSNVYPRQSLTMAIPGNQKAITARMQLGTITVAERR